MLMMPFLIWLLHLPANAIQRILDSELISHMWITYTPTDLHKSTSGSHLYLITGTVG